jgi:hypothetical protein
MISSEGAISSRLRSRGTLQPERCDNFNAPRRRRPLSRIDTNVADVAPQRARRGRTKADTRDASTSVEPAEPVSDASSSRRPRKPTPSVHSSVDRASAATAQADASAMSAPSDCRNGVMMSPTHAESAEAERRSHPRVSLVGSAVSCAGIYELDESMGTRTTRMAVTKATETCPMVVLRDTTTHPMVVHEAPQASLGDTVAYPMVVHEPPRAKKRLGARAAASITSHPLFASVLSTSHELRDEPKHRERTQSSTLLISAPKAAKRGSAQAVSPAERRPQLEDHSIPEVGCTAIVVSDRTRLGHAATSSSIELPHDGVATLKMLGEVQPAWSSSELPTNRKEASALLLRRLRRHAFPRHLARPCTPRSSQKRWMRGSPCP